jgi:hypothetical protein
VTSPQAGSRLYDRLTYSTPCAFRASWLLATVGSVAFIVFVSVVADIPTAFVLAIGFAVTVGGAFRAMRLAVIARGDELIVRNLLRSWRLKRASIGDFVVTRKGLFGYFAIGAVLRDGTRVDFDVFRVYGRAPFTSRGGREREAAAGQLRLWLMTGAAPASAPIVTR